ncbi:hypothetical protein ACOMHN_034591 [Nucella lapillus]
MKMDEEEEKEGGGGDGEDSAKKEDPAATVETEDDKDKEKPEEKPSSPPAGEEEEEKEKSEEGKEEEKSETAEQSEQNEAMEVEESAAEKDKELPEDEVVKEEKETSPSAEKVESTEETGEEAQQMETDASDSKQAEESEEQEEKAEAAQRRYPMRSRKAEEKGASQSAKPNGPASDAKEDGTGSDTGAASVKSDSGSDKENLNSEGAGDTSNAGTPEGMGLWEEEEETEEWKEKKAKQRKLVRRLQAHLRNEEAKLVLLKKLRQSQLTPQVQDHTPLPNTPNSQLPKQAAPRQQGGPPPLVRGGQQVRGSNLHLQQQQQQQNRMPSQSQMRNIQGPPPLVVTTPRMGGGSGGTANGHGSQSIRNTTPHLNQHGASSLRPSQQQGTPTQQSNTPPQVDTQTPAQRQAAAKLALRKQLEKTLLQIPPPKPPAPEMNFIPSLACPDFVLLLGLEEVVNHIIDLQLIARGQKSPDEKFICNPFTCVQCNTDYTPVWKREKPGSKNVICEHCVTWNQKRALKQEHTNRLKSAFVKALQQEQEIERMQQAQTPSNPSPSGTPPASASSSSSAPPQTLAAAAAANSVAAAAAMSMSPASFRHNAAEQVRQHHSFLQAQAQLRAGQSLPGLQGFGARSAFPYNLPYVKQADLQRQYLLDLMPRTGGMPWKQ